MFKKLLKATSVATMSLATALMTLAPQTSQAVTERDFEFHGYFRAGVGTNDKGGDQICLSYAPPWLDPNMKSVGRLGNECATYLETVFVAHHKKAKTAEDSSFKSQVLFAYQNAGHRNIPQGDNEFMSAKLREVYTEATNPFGMGWSFWVGNRFNRWADSHVIDTWYLHDYSGNGAGMTIPVGQARLSLSYMRAVADIYTDNGNIGYTVYDAMLQNLRISDMISLGGFISVGTTPGGEISEGDTVTTKYAESSDTAMGIVAQLNYPGGWAKLDYQQGEGVLTGINTWGAPRVDKRADDNGMLQDTEVEDQTRSLYVFNVYHEIADLTLNGVYAFQAFNNGEEDVNPNGASQMDWQTFVVRGQYAISEHFNVAAEYGRTDTQYEWQEFTSCPVGRDPNNGEFCDVSGQSLQKFTIAPQISVDKGYWSRPALRFFVSWFNWNDKAQDGWDIAQWAGPENKDVKSDETGSAHAAYKDESTMTTYGFQVENWF